MYCIGWDASSVFNPPKNFFRGMGARPWAKEISVRPWPRMPHSRRRSFLQWRFSILCPVQASACLFREHIKEGNFTDKCHRHEQPSIVPIQNPQLRPQQLGWSGRFYGQNRVYPCLLIGANRAKTTWQHFHRVCLELGEQEPLVNVR